MIISSLLLWAALGGTAAVVIANYDSIVEWLGSLYNRLTSASRLRMKRVSSSEYEMEIEGETRIVDESAVPEEIRRKVRKYSTDVTMEARQIGMLKI
ncbi:hypothetical protein [Exiguobacterium sp. MH3]|mgnify:CR=1 FL=1|uniref:hypothetical protein n=1 Tax=Exiguobacterium sp. MH3 TaxID=1399115 RepID=UPI0003C3DF3A|nr:hypothetical protein [Exiguobacterium sp. MH3]AHA31529.1 hypothetical protein U719_14355 [Exiguobacterium sp. MH3]